MKKVKDKSFYVLAKRIAALHRKMESLGMFISDRELMTCPNCGLMEDVTNEGLLTVYRKGETVNDEGLHFIPLDDENRRFQCPNCNTHLEISDTETNF